MTITKQKRLEKHLCFACFIPFFRLAPLRAKGSSLTQGKRRVKCATRFPRRLGHCMKDLLQSHPIQMLVKLKYLEMAKNKEEWQSLKNQYVVG